MSNRPAVLGSAPASSGLVAFRAIKPSPAAEPFPLPVHSGDIRVDVQSALAMLAPAWGLRPLYDIDRTRKLRNLPPCAETLLFLHS